MLESGGLRVVSAASADEALEVLGAGLGIKAVVTDVELSPGGMNGFGLAQRVWRDWRLGVVVMSGRASPEQDELPPGALFLGKPVHRSTLVQLVWDVVGGEPEGPSVRPDAGAEATTGWTLTPRQHEVLALLVAGKSNQEIAEAMGLSENTVKVHLAAIFRVLGVSSRTEALLEGLKRLPPG
jgi:DNA-binding NarL/FixJ family response regulator